MKQEPKLQNGSVKDNLLRGLHHPDESRVNALCNRFNLQEVRHSKDALALSGGEKQKIAVVRGLLKNASVLIMDEPISAMDTAGIKLLKEELIAHKAERITLLISHNEDLLDSVDEFVEL